MVLEKKCRICQEAFMEIQTLRDHVISVHNMICCQFCEHYTINKQKMGKHHRNFHKINPKDFPTNIDHEKNL